MHEILWNASCGVLAICDQTFRRDLALQSLTCSWAVQQITMRLLERAQAESEQMEAGDGEDGAGWAVGREDGKGVADSCSGGEGGSDGGEGSIGKRIVPKAIRECMTFFHTDSFKETLHKFRRWQDRANARHHSCDSH